MKIQDRYVNLAGFLEGDSSYPMFWQSVQLDANLSVDEWRSIKYFQLRAREFLLNVEDLRLPGAWSLSVDRGGAKARIVSNVYPGRHRAKSLFIDFRHFIADKEPSKFQRIVKILARNIDKSHPIQIFLSRLKQNFLRDIDYGISVNGNNLSLARLVHVWFNTEFFHAGRKEQVQEREDWLTILHDEAAHQLLAWGVVNAARTVKSLYACVKDLSPASSRSVNCPDSRLILRDS